MLAVDGIGVMAPETTVRAFMLHLVRPDQDLDEAQEQGHAEDHDDNRDHPAPMALECNVAEAGRCKRGNGEIKGVSIIGNAPVESALALKDDRRHDEDEESEIERRHQAG